MKKLLSIIIILVSFSTYAQTKPEMVLVKGGTFNMGNSFSDKNRKGDEDEKPVHKVKLNSFYIGKYEVTVAQFMEFLADKSYNEFDRFGVTHNLPSPPDSTWWQGHPDSKIYWQSQVGKWWGWNNKYPMFHVSWYEAVAYCNWLSIKSGLNKCYSINSEGVLEYDHKQNGYRLPTEAEWEFAAIGGTQSKGYRFSGSDNFNDVAWIDDNTMLKGPKPVGTKKPNELGIYDMSGNVWEWCYDFYSPMYYAQSPEANPINSRPTGYKVIRGGSWHYKIGYATITTRDGPKSGYTNYNYGFRIAKNK